MKAKIPVIIAAISIVAAAGGISVGIQATNQKLAAQREAQALRDQLNAKTAEEPTRRPETNAAPLVALKNLATIGTNDTAAMQEQLAARDAELERLRAELEARRQPRQSFQERIAQMKEEDPERYAEMVKRRTERQQQMRYDQANRLATFVDMDTSHMTEAELANHNLLVEKLSSMWDQTAEFDPEQPPDRETMRAMFDAMREVRPLMEEERGVMLKQLGTEVGLSGSDVQDFSTYVQDIYSATSLGFPGGGPRGEGRDRGAGGGGQ